MTTRRLAMYGWVWLPILVAGLMLVAGCPAPGPTDNTNDNTDNTNDNQPTSSKYAGAAACAACHSETHTNWAATLHAGALDTLESSDHATDECLGCHTVGYGEDDGFIDRETTPQFAGVQCENCHGPAAAHVADATENPGNLDSSLWPTVDVSSAVCGACHTGEHHPNYEQWQESGHARIDDHVAEYFAAGENLASCGICHSGDYFAAAVIAGDEEVPDDLLAGLDPADMLKVECAICHEPHMQTGNATSPDDGRDFQLRYPDMVSATATNTIADATDASRFNLCGQCHHSRGRAWDSSSRGPHHSIQANVAIGEMPVPEGTDPLVESTASVHASLIQCSGCHMFRKDFEDADAPAISGHTFAVDYLACAPCHTEDVAAEKVEALQAEIQAALDDIAARLGDPTTWEYSAEGGPAEEVQAELPEYVFQVRFLYHYLVSDGSLGVHNPGWIRDIVEQADAILTENGL